MEGKINPLGCVSKNYSLDIEWRMRDIFNCDRFGMGGIADSDFIRSAPYTSMISTLMYLYNERDIVTQEHYKNFIGKYSFYSNYDIDKIISEQGEKEFIEMKNEFLKLLKE